MIRYVAAMAVTGFLLSNGADLAGLRLRCPRSSLRSTS